MLQRMGQRSKSKGMHRVALAGAHVLVVDDHPISLGLMKDVLYAGGAASVHSARDGAEALSLLQSVRPDLLVIDWQMPGMNGLALARTIRTAVVQPDPRIANPRVPIVLVSAHASAAAVEEARRAGIDEVVAKPFSVSSLLKRTAAAAARPRPFIVSPEYIGPDRRRINGPARGRREGELV
jgi:CheY-like chemotaxis protein